jgi:hypothetical protein
MSQIEQVMHQDLSERIRERAYEIWIASGYRDGEADQHWLAAEQAILSSRRSAAVTKAPAKRIRGRATVKPQQYSSQAALLVPAEGSRTNFSSNFSTRASNRGGKSLGCR